MDSLTSAPSAAARARAERLENLPFETVAEGHNGARRSGIASIRAVLSHRELLGLLVNRELKARYKDSSLGLVWSLVRPLAQFLVYFFAIGQILGLARSIPSFAIFVFVGLSMWSLFSEILTSGTTSITSNAGLIKKIYVPREIYPLATVGGALFNFGVQLVILLVATIVSGSAPWHWSLLYAPLSLALVLVYGFAFALALSAINVYLRDVQHLVEVALIVLFWASPIVYSFSFVESKIGGTVLEWLYLSNPVTLAVLGAQKAFWIDGSHQEGVVNFPPNLWLAMLVALAVGFVLLWFAHRIFNRLQANFAQEL